jgi:hypothetical protein
MSQKYNIGDVIHIKRVPKLGVILTVKKFRHTYEYTIFWMYCDISAQSTETVEVSQYTIDNWISNVDIGNQIYKP